MAVLPAAPGRGLEAWARRRFGQQGSGLAGDAARARVRERGRATPAAGRRWRCSAGRSPRGRRRAGPPVTRERSIFGPPSPAQRAPSPPPLGYSLSFSFSFLDASRFLHPFAARAHHQRRGRIGGLYVPAPGVSPRAPGPSPLRAGDRGGGPPCRQEQRGREMRGTSRTGRGPRQRPGPASLPICRTKAAEAAELRWRPSTGCKQNQTKRGERKSEMALLKMEPRPLGCLSFLCLLLRLLCVSSPSTPLSSALLPVISTPSPLCFSD